MKRFIYKILILAGSTAILIVLLNTLYLNSGLRESLLEERETYKYSDMPEYIDIINFGASHGACGFAYTDYPQYSTFNAGLGSQEVVYDLMQLECFSDRINDGAIVILPVSYGVLYTDLYSFTELSFERYNKRYYDILEFEYIIEGDSQYYYLNRTLPVICHEFSEILELAEAYLTDEIPDSETNIEGLSDAEIEVIAQARYIAFTGGDDQYGEELPATVMDAYQKIFDICDAIGATPVLVTTPLYEAQYNCWTDEFLEKFYCDIDTIIGDRDILYLDYSACEGIYDNKSCFRDSDHLNEVGALAFTEVVLSDIDSLIGLPEPSVG